MRFGLNRGAGQACYPCSDLNDNSIKENLLEEWVHWTQADEKSMAGWVGIECHLNEVRNIYPLQYLDIQLGRISWEYPLSERLSELFLVQPQSVKPRIVRCDDNLASEMAYLMGRSSLSMLLQAYRTSRFLEGSASAWNEEASCAINVLSTQIRNKCQCKWGKTKCDQWTQYMSDVNMSSLHSCPHRYAVEELYSEWVNPLPDSFRSRSRFLDFYKSCCVTLEMDEVAEIIGATLEPWRMPVLKIRCSSAALQILDSILLLILRAHIEEIFLWLKAISEGASPRVLNPLPASVFLVKNHRGIDSIIAWPVGSDMSFKNIPHEKWAMGLEAEGYQFRYQ